MHNLIGLIWPEAAYIAHYNTAFLKPARVGAYNPSIYNNATAIAHPCTEAAHKEKRTDHTKYETARRETAQLILAVVADTWVRELRDTKMLYTEVEPKDLLSHLEVLCTVRHALDLLDLHNEIQRYHLEFKGTPKYINMLKDAQKQAGQSGRTIANKTLLIFATTAMLTTNRFLCTNDDWEDCAESDKR